MIIIDYPLLNCHSEERRIFFDKHIGLAYFRRFFVLQNDKKLYLEVGVKTSTIS
jgi:hypothetical protein